MPEKTIAIISLLGLFAVFMIIMYIANIKTLNIKSKTVGDGQHGTARFATNRDINKAYIIVPYHPKTWRTKNPDDLPQGIIVGCRIHRKKVFAIVDTDDVHTLMIGAAGVGKTAKFLYPNMEYCCACGMSFIVTDTKGDVLRSYASIASKYYGYDIAVIDLRNPTQSDGFNMLYMVNYYMDIYLSRNELGAKAKAEKYAKITAKTIIYSGGFDSGSAGQNAFFYDAAEGLITSIILVLAEFCSPIKNPKLKEEGEQRHIISVFKLIQDLFGASQEKGKTQFKVFMEKLPSEHKARWFAGAAINTAEASMQSVMSTALSRLNAFLDSEIEQLLCFDTKLNTEKFCKGHSALFLVMPEEDSSKYFLVSLIIQQVYREMLAVADELGGKLPKRAMMFLDEYGTLPKIESAEMMFSASRSRKISIVPIIQSLAQLDRNYGKEGSEIIVDNCQLTIYGGFAPNSETANVLSKNLGEKTVMTGSVSQGKDKSKSLQMTGRPLLTPDELKSMPKDHFIVTKTGAYPMESVLRLFFKWGIELDQQYKARTPNIRKVFYADKDRIEADLEKERQKRLMETAKQKMQSKVVIKSSQETGKAVKDIGKNLSVRGDDIEE